jgi:hypothetical protein
MTLREMAPLLIEGASEHPHLVLGPDFSYLHLAVAFSKPPYHVRLDLQPSSFYLLPFTHARFCLEIPTNLPPLLVGSSRYM